MESQEINVNLEVIVIWDLINRIRVLLELSTLLLGVSLKEIVYLVHLDITAQELLEVVTQV